MLTSWEGDLITPVMKTAKVFNVVKDQVILEKAYIADSFLLRLRGLLGRKELAPAEGLIIKPCNAIHTIGMAFAIDVAFVDAENRICHIIDRMGPNKVGKAVKNARYVIEGPAGLFVTRGVAVGDIVKLIEN